MPSVEHTKLVAAPFPEVWDFVSDMDNWAPLVTGYTRHEKIDDRESIWFLKGELGGLTRIAEFKAIITEWDDSGRVLFELEGINEPVTGSGEFVATVLGDAADDQPIAEPAREGFLKKIGNAVVRFIFGMVFGNRSAASKADAADAEVGQSPETSILFKLNLHAGGAAGMAMNMLITPMLKPVAQDLADNIAEAIADRRKARAA